MEDEIVIVDTREQRPWNFEAEEKKSGHKSRIVGSQVDTLDCGDYTLLNYEHCLRIERKMGFGELLGNMTPIAHKERFEREMEKLSQYKYKYIVIEGNINNDLLGMSPVQFKYAPPCSSVLRWLIEIHMKYGVVPIFAGDAGKRVVRNIFEMVVREECPSSKKK